MRKITKEVASILLDVFLNIGAQNDLQSDNGREFTAEIIKELVLLWPNLVMVNSSSHYTQS